MKTDTHKRMALKKLVQAMAILEQAKSQLILMRENELDKTRPYDYIEATVLVSHVGHHYDAVQETANKVKNFYTEKI